MPTANNEMQLGYIYVANPGPAGSLYKIKKPVPQSTAEMNATLPFVGDVCQAPRPCPDAGSQVTVWGEFAHDGIDRAAVCNLLMGEGHVEARQKDSLTIGYEYIAEHDLYW